MWYLDPVPRNCPLAWSVAEHPSSPKVILIANCCLDSSFCDTSISICCARSWELVRNAKSQVPPQTWFRIHFNKFPRWLTFKIWETFGMKLSHNCWIQLNSTSQPYTMFMLNSISLCVIKVSKSYIDTSWIKINLDFYTDPSKEYTTFSPYLPRRLFRAFVYLIPTPEKKNLASCLVLTF